MPHLVSIKTVEMLPRILISNPLIFPHTSIDRSMKFQSLATHPPSPLFSTSLMSANYPCNHNSSPPIRFPFRHPIHLIFIALHIMAMPFDVLARKKTCQSYSFGSS